ncbi:hypothetical protein AOLI_G00019820 [Acnodon oligacanthus]
MWGEYLINRQPAKACSAKGARRTAPRRAAQCFSGGERIRTRSAVRRERPANKLQRPSHRNSEGTPERSSDDSVQINGFAALQ